MRRLRSVFSLGSILAALAATFAFAAPASALTVGYELKTSGASNMCLNENAWTLDPGAVISYCNGDASQGWSARAAGSTSQGTYYEVRDLYGVCIDWGKGYGNAAITQACNGAVTQKWYIITNSDGTTGRLVSYWWGLCLGTNQGSMQPETKTILWNCNGNPDQRWYWGNQIWAN